MKTKETISAGANGQRGVQRRDFLKILGGGIFIFFRVWDPSELLGMPLQQRRSLPTDFNAFLRIADNGSVSCYTGKIEMGQGINRSLAQIMADELDVQLEMVNVVLGDTELCPWDAGTNGSRTIRFYAPPMRAACAEARAILLQIASEQLGVPLSRLQISDGIISDRQNAAKKVSYGQLAKGKKIERYLEHKPDPKNYKEYKYVNNSYLRQDSKLKVTGVAKFVGDFSFPGMLHARILRPPSHGASLVKADVSGAEKIKGVQVVRHKDLVAVLHEDRNVADEAVVKIKAEYSFNEMNVDDKTIFKHLLKVGTRSAMVASSGDLETGKRIVETITESEFYNSYVAHAPMETHTALAKKDGEKITVWVSTQQPFPVQESIARELDLPLEKVRVIVPFVGGGFGGKSAHRQALEAARLAWITGRPVMVAWTRQEEFFYNTFRPAAVVKITSGTDKAGKIILWDYNVYFAGSRGSDTIYDVPHASTRTWDRDRDGPQAHPFGTGAWRAPGNNTNTFARESQIAIMASKAGIDPLEFRLKNLKDERMIGVLKAAADLFGYTPAKTPSGRGIGIACGIDVGTYVAHIAEVKVSNDGRVKVIRVACAQDMGLCINPEGTKIQMEGCITMGLGYAFTEEIAFTGGNIKTRNFDSYRIPLFSWVPEIKTIILDKKDQPSQGGGEPTIICMGAVMANAVFDATGARLYQLPMTPSRIAEAMKKNINIIKT